MEILQLRYFLAVARAGSFVKAAEEEGIAQPSLSQQIKKLEAELGVPLFDRLGRSVCLTRYGVALKAQAELISRQLIQAGKALEALKNSNEGHLNVGVIPTVLPYTMVSALSAFREQFPQVKIDVREMMTEKLIDALRGGELDLAVLALPVKHEEIVCSELFREALVAALPSAHPLASRNSISLKELEEQPLLLLREGHCLRNEVLTACSRAKSRFANTFESDQLESIFAMVESGFGLSLVPEMAARKRAGCRFLPIDSKPQRRIGYALAAGHAELPLQRNFIRFLKKWDWQQ
jgi:LysR family transcriptional regulator, hydrogen peroxide-inducible genes activator